MKILIMTLLLISYSAFGQITITSADVSAQFTPGNSTVIKTDTITTSVDIGQLGSTSWDFSFLVPNPGLDIIITSVDPNSTPYIGTFPGANLASHSITDFAGIQSENYSYLSVNGAFNSHGSVTEADFAGFLSTTTITNDPVKPVAVFPFTYNSDFSYSGETTVLQEIQGFPPTTTMITVICTTEVDAYGPMTLPGGRIVDALRIQSDEINIVQGPVPVYTRTINYTFLAKDGSQVSFSADTTQPETGVINNEASISWNDAFVTAVEIDEKLPVEYSLRQNYPNPFNPTTTIEFTIPEQSFVTLKIYDVLGNEVSTVTNEYLNAGAYKEIFDASGLSSGLYFAKITAGNFSETIKMSLLK